MVGADFAGFTFWAWVPVGVFCHFFFLFDDGFACGALVLVDHMLFPYLVFLYRSISLKELTIL